MDAVEREEYDGELEKNGSHALATAGLETRITFSDNGCEGASILAIEPIHRDTFLDDG